MAVQTDLDATDRVILRLLQRDARQSNKQIAAAAGLSPSASLARVRRLQETGVIRGFHAALDPGAVGVGIEALVTVHLTSGSRAVAEAFADHARALPAVVDLYLVSGAPRFVIHVAARDVEHLRQLEHESLGSRPEVRAIETAVVFERVAAGGLPLYERDDDGT